MSHSRTSRTDPGTAAPSRRWRLFVDTGGTFTDCLARTPEGSWRRAKVLSSSALRGRVVTEPGVGTSFLGVGPWPEVEDFFAGFTCRLQRQPEVRRRVVAFGFESGRFELEAPFPFSIQAEEAFELLSPEEAPILAARMVTGTPQGEPLPPIDLRLATTRGTNALLERRGGRTVLFITEGFGDLLEIGTQQRPELFALEVKKPRPLADRVVEVPERLAADGSVLRPLKVRELEGVVEELLAEGFEAAAVALMHSYRRTCHEEHLEAFLRRSGFAHVSASSALAPRIKLLPRAQTAVVDAYLSPVVHRYLERVRQALAAGSRLHVMTSAGGLVRAEDFSAKDSLVSGPAGGVVGASRAGLRSGLEKIIAFDMGGTSTDVSRFAGDYEYRQELTAGDAELLAPALAIRTVAAGGGSVCTFDGQRLRVGPESAGADPGPACYGAGGPLTLTDVNLLLGRLDAGAFEIPVDREAAERALGDLVAGLGEAAEGRSREALLQGLLTIADELMADAVRAISAGRGFDPAEHALVAFGGAGGQHACAVAELLGIRTVLVPADAALLSAAGLAEAVVERFAQRQVLLPLAEVGERLSALFLELEEQATGAVAAEGVEARQVEVRRRSGYLRLVGQDSTLEVPWPPPAPSVGEAPGRGALESAFAQAYGAVYGYPPPPRAIEVESLEVVASSREAEMIPLPATRRRPEDPSLSEPWRVFLAGEWRSVPAFRRQELVVGSSFEGPALVFERHSATLVLPSWRGTVDPTLALRLDREDP